MVPSEDPNDAALRAASELHAAEEYERLQAAAALADAETEEPERRVLVAAHEHLGMDVSYCSHFTAGEQVVRRAHGDARAFGLQPGTRFPLGDTYCQRVVDGRLPNLIADTRRDRRVADLAPRVGSYIGVPVSFSDGRLYGTLSCAGHGPAPWLRERDIAFMRVLGRMLTHELERREIERTAQHHRNEAIALGALFAGLDARDSYTGRHSEAVVELSVRVARELGMPEAFVEEVKQVALLHDIGKIGIPDAILAKPGPLDEAEWELMYTHPVVGARIVASIPTLAPLAPAIRAEHERWDGKGYPDGLARGQIPLASRITFACDAYHAMISSRPYRLEPMSAAAAAAELREHAGTQFDPDVVAAQLRVI
ncbi:MAG: HD domain-containing protein [Actinomycetota bacterium]|nr:HD domain-containing protein [Actinomycetota bacterium]